MNIVIACGKTQPQGRVGVLRRRGPTAALSSIKELRRFRLKRRQVASCALKPSTHIGAIVALACVLFGDASANVAVSKILNDMSYHDSEDLVDAGARMLRDAVAHGLDINEIEMDGPATSLGDTANGRLRFGIGINVVELNMRGRSYPERLRQEKAVADTSLHVAILVANRGLSIGEMSELLRARVRILAFGELAAT